MRGLFRRTAPVVDDDGNVVEPGMLPAQRAVWEQEHFVRALVGGYGSGKTNLNAKFSIALALQNAPAPHGLVSPTYKMARDTTVVSVAEQLTWLQRRHRGLRYRYNKTLFEFSISFRGRRAKIRCYSGENPDSLKGPNLGSASIDEPFIQSREVFRQMVARVRHPKSLVKTILLTGTPEQLNWGWELCEGEDRDKYDIGVVTASTRDNLTLPGYADRLAQAFAGDEAEAFIEGKFKHLGSGLVFYGFNPQIHVQEFEMVSGARWGLGLDFNVNPMAGVVFWHVGNEYIHFVDEFELPNSDTEYAAAYVREKYPECEDVYPDPSGRRRSTNSPGGRSDFHFLEKAGFTVHAPKGYYPYRDSLNACNSAYAPSDGSRPRISISKKCKKLSKYLASLSHETKKEQAREMSHLLDAHRYPITNIMPVLSGWKTMKVTGF